MRPGCFEFTALLKNVREGVSCVAVQIAADEQNQLMIKCTARSAWMHCKEKKQTNKLAVKCSTRRSKLLKFIFRKNYYVTFWLKMEITDLLGLSLEMSMHNFIEIFLE